MLNDFELEEKLKTHFHYESFRTGQLEIIKDILLGKDVLGVLPTGSGKSICYQLPAVLLDGLTIVVSPLISLMIDQEKELKAKKIKQVATLNSFIDYEQRQYIYQHLDQYKLLYISPELLQQDYLLKRISKQNISLFVIDEAHCISQWGHEFRPDYLKLGRIIEQLQDPPVLALSATATPSVQDDIMNTLKRKNMKKRIYPMDRNNLMFVVEDVKSEEEKMDLMTSYLQKDYGPTLIYFSSRIQTEIIASHLMAKLPNLKIAFYHGGMEQIDRVTIQQQFMNEQLDVICCTSAFGMGINKQNIRLIIHYHIPSQMEAYIQAVGRAGRDSEASVCLMLYSPRDTAIPKRMIENELPTEAELCNIMQHLRQMSEQEIDVPIQSTEAVELFQISEIKWRFLRFHFEKHGMIIDNKIVYNSRVWQTVYTTLINWITNRILHKQQELREMILWAETDECLRKTLYSKFQSGYGAPKYQCCSNCGIDLSEWEPTDRTNTIRNDQADWSLKLRKLLIGDEV